MTVPAGVGCGLVAGLLFVFSAGVMPGLGRLPAEQGAAAMRAINRGILNPVFLGVFAGTGVALVVAAVLTGGPAVVAAGLYLVGVLGVTGVVNVPLNEALDADRVTWERYRVRWTRWNHVRTASAVAGLALLLT
jgi:uncharacterized membrane protein